MIAVKEPTKAIETDNNGRPYKYETHVLPRLKEIYKWLKEGMTEYSIAEQLGIHRHSLMKYKEEEKDLIDIFTRARTERNCLVMHKMYEKAVGYEHKDLFIAQYQGEIVEKEINKYYPPDVNAADLYLRNNSEDYKGAKSEGGNLTLIQNNFQLPQIAQQIKLLEEELKKLESPQAVDVQVIEDK
jgi:hypothetical protein